MSKPLKILVCGDVEGNFDQLFQRISSIQKKAGQFDMLLCVGDFFGEENSQWQKYSSNSTEVPVSTFILGPNKPEHASYFPDPEGGDLCNNITYLGRRGVYTGSTGLSIAYLSGQDGTISSESGEVHFSNNDVDALMLPRASDGGFQGVDILLTSPWPKAVEKYGIAPDGGLAKAPSMSVAQLAMGLKPRYHFAGLEGMFYERQPYRNHKVLAEKDKHVTRFLGLAKVNNKDKKKYLYAFNITPLKHMAASELVKQPLDVTESPFIQTALRRAQKKEEQGAQFFYDQQVLDKAEKRQRREQNGPAQKKHAQAQGPCWFCLGSPEVEKQLVVSVGSQSYMTIAKGGLTSDHILILPIGHHQSTVVAPKDVVEEIDLYKNAIKKCFRSHGKAAVFFERNYKSQHLQIQVVPVPDDLSEEVKETVLGCALSQDIQLQEIPKHSDLRQIVPAGAPYFYAEMPSGEKLLYRISKGFPLQFGREALAHDSLLNMPDRVDWRNCKWSKEEESENAQKFKKMFKEFDFNF